MSEISAREGSVVSLLVGVCLAGSAAAQTTVPSATPTGQAGSAASAGAPAAQAQAPFPAADAAPASGTDVVVTGERPSVETSIDRKSYSLARDVQATTGSAADVLRDVPSVTVDVDGNPSLRGDANVQILLDGRPAPQFNNTNRGAALQQLGADTIDRVEVLTNPPANFKPDGSAGVINIITKKRTARDAATAQASLGSSGRYNLGATGSTKLGPVAIHGSATLRHDLRTRFATDERRVSDPTSGAFLSASSQRIVATNDRLSKIGTLGADYDIGARDHLSAEGTYNVRTESTAFDEQNVSLDAAGAPLGRADRYQRGNARETNTTALARYRHDIGKDGDGLTVLAQRSETSETEHFRYRPVDPASLTLPAFDDQTIYGDEITREFSVDLVRTLPGQAKLTAGYDLQRDDNTFDDLRTTRASAAAAPVVDAALTNRFLYGQTIHALYASYERAFGHLTVLPGLRVEQVDIQTNQVTTGQRGSSGYFRVYPNLHLSDQVSDHQTLTFSYGQRVIRPDAEDLNPFPVQQDAFTIRRGNPALKPEEIRSLEAGWSFDRGATSRSATLYLRQSRNRVTNVTQAAGPSLLVVTKQNLGTSTSGGLEVAAAGKLLAGLDYNLSGNLFYNTIDAANLGFAATRSTVSYEAKAALNWHASRVDTVQVNVGGVGRRLTPQGYRIGYVGVDLGARHQLRKNLALTATLSDLFASRREGSVVSVPGLSDVSRRRQTGRIVYLGLSWSLPGAKAKAEKFDYEK